VTPHQRKIAAIVPRLLEWFSGNARDLPWRRTRDPYAIWVSEIMLQQTQVKTVMPYWERWMRELPNVGALAGAPLNRVHKLWEGLGYYARARNLRHAAQVIVRQHGGQFPSQFEQVLALPGIGRYTAGAICSIAFNQPYPVLDGNIIRVLTRLWAIAQNPRRNPANTRLWALADELVRLADKLERRRGGPSSSRGRRCSHLNQALMELGSTICTPRGPHCRVCPVARFCQGLQLGSIDKLPNLGARPASTARRLIAFVIRRNGRFLVRQRPPGVPNAGLWEFPNCDVSGRSRSPERDARKLLGITPKALQPLCSIQHTITRSRITIDVITATISNHVQLPSAAGRRLTPNQLLRLPFAGADRKILRRLPR
jgi:A/G-specific adenine glycosylase